MQLAVLAPWGSEIRASILPSVAAVVSGYLENGVQCAVCRVQVTLYCVICSVWCTAFSLKLAVRSMMYLVCSMQHAVCRPSKCPKVYTNMILGAQSLRQKVRQFGQNLNSTNFSV